jgi:hypothetical protein
MEVRLDPDLRTALVRKIDEATVDLFNQAQEAVFNTLLKEVCAASLNSLNASTGKRACPDVVPAPISV